MILYIKAVAAKTQYQKHSSLFNGCVFYAYVVSLLHSPRELTLLRLKSIQLMLMTLAIPGYREAKTFFLLVKRLYLISLSVISYNPATKKERELLAPRRSLNAEFPQPESNLIWRKEWLIQHDKRKDFSRSPAQETFTGSKSVPA